MDLSASDSHFTFTPRPRPIPDGPDPGWLPGFLTDRSGSVDRPILPGVEGRGDRGGPDVSSDMYGFLAARGDWGLGEVDVVVGVDLPWVCSSNVGVL